MIRFRFLKEYFNYRRGKKKGEGKMGIGRLGFFQRLNVRGEEKRKIKDVFQVYGQINWVDYRG